MKRFTLIALAVALMSAGANANSIFINAGESPTFPPTFTLLASGTSPLILPPTVCCGVADSFTIAASAVGTPPLPSGQLDTSTIAVSASGPGTLFIWITETGITSPAGLVRVTSGLTDNLEQGAISGVTLATFLDPSNGVAPPLGTLLDTFSFTHIGAQSNGVGLSAGGPYSLEALYEITATGAGNVNLTIDMTAQPVAEPATLILLGSALLGLTRLRKRAAAV
jgi:hypothetical protein